MRTVMLVMYDLVLQIAARASLTTNFISTFEYPIANNQNAFHHQEKTQIQPYKQFVTF
jgi:hypothetical protein